MLGIRADFRDRRREIVRYLRMIEFVEQHGWVIVSQDNRHRHPLDLTTRHVLKASVYLHLYNLMESTVTACLLGVATEIGTRGTTYEDLIDEWQSCFLRTIGKPDQPLNPENRLESLRTLCGVLIAGRPLTLTPNFGGGGNLDDKRIEILLNRYGVKLQLTTALRTHIKKPVINDYGPLTVIKMRRNQLAHGFRSFGECGKDVTFAELRAWTCIVFRYLSKLITAFDRFVNALGFERKKP